MHWNSPSSLPPVNCPLLIKVDGKAVRARRPTFAETKEDTLVFILEETGVEIHGRFQWTYP